MGRRSEHTREELKALIISTAYNLMEESGLKNFSARKVARKIGYSVGTIYHIFDSHDDFMLHVNGKTLDVWYTLLLESFNAKQRFTILDLGIFYIEFSKSHFNSWLAIFDYIVNEEYKVPDWFHEKIHKFFSFLESLFENELECTSQQAAEYARIYWSAVHGICILAHTGSHEFVQSAPPETLILKFTRIFLSGLQEQDS